MSQSARCRSLMETRFNTEESPAGSECRQPCTLFNVKQALSPEGGVGILPHGRAPLIIGAWGGNGGSRQEEEQQMDGEKRIWRKAGTTAKRKQEKERMRGTHPPPSYRSECPDCARSPPNILRMMIRNTPSRDGDILGDRHRARGRTVAPSSAITPPMVAHISLRWRHCELIEALDKRAHSAAIMRG